MQNRFIKPIVTRVAPDDLPDELIRPETNHKVPPDELPEGHESFSLFTTNATLYHDAEDDLHWWAVDAFMRPHRQIGRTIRFTSATEVRDGDRADEVGREFGKAILAMFSEGDDDD